MNYELADIGVKAVATLGALLFFIYKVLAGGFVAATSLSLAVVPTKCEGKGCALVTTKLEHPGENWSSFVTRAELTVVVDGKHRAPPILILYKDPSRDAFELGPGEKTEYGTIVDMSPLASQL